MTNEQKYHFALNYLGCEYTSQTGGGILTYNVLYAYYISGFDAGFRLILKDLNLISNDEAIQIAKYAHQQNHNKFKVVKRDPNPQRFIVHIEHTEEIGICYHVSINDYACINVNVHHLKTEDDPAQSFKVNIGEIQTSSQRPIPYIAITDFLRANHYLMPFQDLTIKQIKKSNFINL